MSVTVSGLVRRYPNAERPAVEGISFVAERGAITTLLGPSGSGKTTVLRILAGLESADQGRVCFGDRDVTDVAPQKRRVGLVFQGYALFPHLTVRENVAFGLSVRGVDRRVIDDRVRALLDRVRLPGHGGRYPRELSGGERQRIAFARALAVEPDVLLLDEPFGALDARVRVELRAWLRHLHEDTKLTTVLVTHDQEEALEVSDRIVVMRGGKVEQVGTPRDVYERPTTPFVASFVGVSNLLRGRVEGGRVALSRMRDASVAAPEGAVEGDDVSAFVRADDLELRRANACESETDSEIELATIERITHVGATVRVAVRLPSGAPLTVHSPRAELEALALVPGDRVLVNVREACVFVGHFSI
ncbi:MAG: sulfate/molybdate ABC transporter ATP-binding protein [Polyangiales bacterium]